MADQSDALLTVKTTQVELAKHVGSLHEKHGVMTTAIGGIQDTLRCHTEHLQRLDSHGCQYVRKQATESESGSMINGH